MTSVSTSALGKLLNAAFSKQSGYIAATLATNGIFVFRSYIAMLTLNYRELGMMAVIQTLVLLIATMQFGLLNGGYRILCSADDETARRLNNLAYSLIAVLTATISLISPFLLVNFSTAGGELILAAGVATGSFTLIRTWINNQLIAIQRLSALNYITFFSGIASVIPLILINHSPFFYSVLSLLLQPFVFIVIALWRFPALRPDCFKIDLTLLKSVLRTGFLIFVAGLLLQLNSQLERWYVVSYLGLDALGHLYLSILFISLFTIVPNALQALYVPRIVAAHEAEKEGMVGMLMGRLLLLSVAYCIGCVLLVSLAMEPILAALMPRYVADSEYVFILLPGLTFFTIAGSLAIICNILMDYRGYIASFAVGTLITGFGILLLSKLEMGASITEVTWVKSIAYLTIGLGLVVAYGWLCRLNPAFRIRLIVPVD